METYNLQNSDAINLNRSVGRLTQLSREMTSKKPGVDGPTDDEFEAAATAVRENIHRFVNSPLMQRNVPHHRYSNAAVKAMRSMYASCGVQGNKTS